jgi:transposase
MKIIGCDFHPSFQQIAMLDTETGEQEERRLTPGQAVQFYGQLKGQARVGMEACGNTQWFESLLAKLGHELWLGDAGKIRAMEVRKQKTDRRDAELLLRLLLEGRFPRLWVPSQEQRDLRQLLLHRHKLVGMRRQVKNQWQHLALNQGVQRKQKLWSQAGRKLLEQLPLAGWTRRRREELLILLGDLEKRINELDVAVEHASEQDGVARLLQTHPGVGPITALAFSLTLGQIERFAHSRQVVSYLGLNPREHSSGGRQRMGAIQQARQSDDAEFVGGGGTKRGPSGTGVKTRLSAAEAQKAFCCGQGDGGAKTGSAAVLDVENTAAVWCHSHAG